MPELTFTQLGSVAIVNGVTVCDSVTVPAPIANPNLLGELSTNVELFCAVNKDTVPVIEPVAPIPVCPTVVAVNGDVLGVKVSLNSA